MFRKWGIPALSILGVAFALVMIIIGLQRPKTPPIAYLPPTPPYTHYVAGSGIIEASSLNIQIGTPIQGVVEKVFVQPGEIVKKGDPLFRVDTRQLAAQKQQALANVGIAIANFHKLQQEPRPEQIPPLEAKVKQAQMHLSDEASQYNLFQNVSDKRAISLNDFSQRKYAARLAKYQYQQAKAELDLLEAGTWIEDLKIANAQLEEARAQLFTAETNLARATIQAPLDGQVMQVKLAVGDFILGSNENTSNATENILLFGQIDPLHIRIDIDEEDAWRVFANAPAVAFVRGNRSIQIPLEFVRIEPFIVPKRSLTGDLEKVDTRVLQLIYKFSKQTLPVYVGQLLDVYIEAKPSQGL